MSLINDMLHDLASRERGIHWADVKPGAYSPLPRAGALPSATGLNSQHWWRPLLWLNVLLIMSLVALAATWWLHRPAGWPNGPLTETASVQAPEPVLATSATPAPSAEPAHPSVPAPGQTTDSLAVTTTLPASPTSSVTLSAIVTAPELSQPPVATRTVSVAPKATPVAERPLAKRTDAPPPAVKAPPVQTAAMPVVAAPATVGNPPRADKPPQTTPEPTTSAAPSRATPGTPTLASESSAQWAENRLLQARTERKQGAHEAAVLSFKALLQQQPQHVAARLELASLLQERKQPSAAADLLSEGLMLLPRQTSFTLALAPLWIQAGQQADAMALLEQGARHASPKDGPYHAYYASQLLRLKRPVQAQQHFELAVASDPGRGEWLLGLGLALQANGKTPEAIAAFQRASASGQLAPQNKAMVEQAIARLQKGS